MLWKLWDTVSRQSPSTASYELLPVSSSTAAGFNAGGTIKYIEGLRGAAALAVTLHTFIYAIESKWEIGYGFGIPVFCVIAGYVLAYKSMQQFRSESWDLMLSRSSSYLFRRAIRLLLPAILTTLLAMMMVRLRLYSFALSTTFERPSMPLPRLLSAQLKHWMWQTIAFIFPLHTSRPRPLYNPILWTLPVLLRDSMILVLAIIGIARSRRVVRWIVIGYLLWQAYRNDQLNRMAMLGGVLLAEIDTRDQNLSLDKTHWEAQVIGTRMVDMLNWSSFLLGLILMALPRSCSDSDVTTVGCDIQPRDEVWQCIGSVLAVAAVGRTELLQRAFSAPALQYFGRISFALYLVHYPILLTLGYRIVGGIVGKGPLQMSMTIFLGLGASYILTMISTTIMAHLFWRFIDVPVKGFGIWLETKCSPDNEIIRLEQESGAAGETSPTREEKAIVIDYFMWDLKDISVPSADRMLRILKEIGWFLIPSPIQDRLSGIQKPIPKLHPTAYLDGLRGWASLFVLIYHTVYKYHPSYRNGYGFDPEHSYFVQLPIIRLIYTGPVMVFAFFVISGFSLSFKPLKQIRQGHSSKQLLLTLSSSIFRRGARLFLPVIAITFIAMLVIHSGVFDGTHDIFTYPDFEKDYSENAMPRYTHFFAQFWDWLRQCEGQLRIWSQFPKKNSYNPYSWSISVEYQCSMAVFAVLVTLANTKTWVRMVTIAGFVYYLSYLDGLGERLFLMGILLAEISLIQMSRSTAQTLGEHPSKVWRAIAKRSLWWLPFVAGLFLLSTPETNGADTPGWKTLSRITTELNLQVAGIPFLIISIQNNEELQWLFNNSLSRYLGSISFALYLCQFLTIHTIGHWLIPVFQKVTGTETLLKFELGFWAGNIFVLISTFWFADVFWRAVDLPSVTFARWLENICIIRS